MKRLYRMAHTSFSFSFPLVLVEPGLLPHKHVAITSPVLAVAAHRTLGTSGAIETRFTMMLLDDDNDNVDDDVWHDNTDCSFCARARSAVAPPMLVPFRRRNVQENAPAFSFYTDPMTATMTSRKIAHEATVACDVRRRDTNGK